MTKEEIILYIQAIEKYYVGRIEEYLESAKNNLNESKEHSALKDLEYVDNCRRSERLAWDLLRRIENGEGDASYEYMYNYLKDPK